METARTTLSTSVEELRASLLEVLTACPVEQCNPGTCPLHCLRELDYPRRIQWLNALDRNDLQFLAAYHCACMKVKQQVTPTVKTG